MDDKRFVSRGGLKLDAALSTFGIDAAGHTCADLGCSTGGFTDCLLQRGATQVFAIDTAYGELAWTIRNDPRVVVMERTNALHADPPQGADHACNIVTVDLGWTKQDKALPVARKWCQPAGHIITLIKPHYESGQHHPTDQDAKTITQDVLARLPEMGFTVLGCEPAVIRGRKGNNLEFVAWLQPQSKK